MRYTIDVVRCRRSENRKQLFLTRYSCPASDPKKNIVCLHGLTFSQHVFDIDYKDYSFLRYLCRNGYTAWALDVSGHGRSQRVKNGFDITTETAADDVIDAMEVMRQEQDVDKVDLLGWSWGTDVVALAASKRPELVDKLVLMAPVTGGTDEGQAWDSFTEDKMMIPYEFAARLFRHKGVASGDVDADAEIDYDITEPEVVNLAMHNLLRYDAQKPKPWGPNRDVLSAGPKMLIHPEDIKSPTLYIKGTDDIYSTVEIVEDMVAKSPEGSKFVLVRGGGHGFFFERDYYQPGREAILDFLKN